MYLMDRSQWDDLRLGLALDTDLPVLLTSCYFTKSNGILVGFDLTDLHVL